jgi:hypothetical protein
LTSIRQQRANRANAKHTPKTKAGRVRSSTNAFATRIDRLGRARARATGGGDRTSIAHSLLAIRPPFHFDFVGAADVAVLQVNPDGCDALVTSN